MKKLKVLGICAGNGASLYTFQKSKKFEVLGNIEPRAVFHSKDNNQWYSNFNSPIWRLPNDSNDELDVDVIVGHPDCGASSILTLSRKKKFLDPTNNDSIKLFIDSLDYYSPQHFLLENLPKFLDYFTKEWWRSNFPGYNLTFFMGSVSEFGNSQVSRERLVIMGQKKGATRINTRVKPVKELKSVKELIGDLDGKVDIALGHVREPLTKSVCLWVKGSKMTLGEVYDLWNSQFKDQAWWPGHYNAKTQPGVYKLFPTKFPRTVRKQNRQFDHLGLSLTPRQMARIQGLPDSFKIYIEDNKKEYWINKGRTTIAKNPPYEIFLWYKKQLIKTL